MNKPQILSIADYAYDLSEERIAKYPLEERDASKLLIYKNGHIQQDVYRNIANHLPEKSLLIFNNTKVVEARLLFQKPSGGSIEIFCLEPHDQYVDITAAMKQQGKVWWKCLVGGASKWKPGQVLFKEIMYDEASILLEARHISKSGESFVIELSWKPVHCSFAEVLHHAGIIPLPPYIKRPPEEKDKERYQTIYAAMVGSVAAPTAGLHFTNQVFGNLRQRNIRADYVTLHVGAGTFKPVKTAVIGDHEMHAEWIDVHQQVIEKIIGSLNENIIAVGTTSLRTLESLYWLGVKCIHQSSPAVNNIDNQLLLSQWEVYDLADMNIPVADSLKALLQWMKNNNMDRMMAKTQILIAPGYKFKIVRGLVTNFHQPQSTLLLLIAALIGSNWKRVYNYALENDFRFLSYGDGSLLWYKED